MITERSLFYLPTHSGLWVLQQPQQSRQQALPTVSQRLAHPGAYPASREQYVQDVQQCLQHFVVGC